MMDERNAVEDLKWLSRDDDLLESCGRSGAVHRVAMHWITRAVEAEASRDKLRAAIEWISIVNDALPISGELAIRTVLDIRKKARAALTPTAKEPA